LRGNVLKAAEYYQEAYRLYQSWHDEVRAAQIQANRGAMLIEYGKPDEGIDDIENAFPVLGKLRDRRFQILCLRARATYYRNQGRHKEAMRELNMGLQLASAQNLAEPMGLMRTFLAVSQLEMGEYDQARQSLLHALKDGTGRQITEARIRLARTYVRLGDFAQADEELQRAERELQASPNASRQSLLSLVRGEWAFESGRPSRELRASFERARAVVPEPLRELEPSAIEARAYLGFMHAGRLDLGRQMIRDSIRAAESLRQLSLQARCRLLLAEIETAQRRFRDAHELLNQIPREDDERTLGPDLRAQSHYLRGRLESAQGNIAAADQNAAAAQELIRKLEERLPQEYRALFAKRQTVRRLLR
jgi:tetratricopeptide (TPR) repeat protein